MPFLGKTPTVGNFILLDAITVSNTATFALTKDTVDYYPGSAQNMIVSVNGVTQAPLTAYTITDSNIIFSSALDSDVDVIDYILVLGDTLNIGRPSDSTVGATQLQDYAVTSVKMSNTGVGAATYGTSTSIPQITIDAAGRITSATGIDRSNQFEDLTVTGNLTVSGNTVTVDAQTLSVEDPLIHLAANNETSDVVDIGFVGHYSNDGGTTKLHTGFFRDASDEQYYLFNGFEDDNLDLSSPSTTIDRTANTFSLADLNVGIISATKLSSRDGVLELDDDGTHNGIINVPATLLINIDSDNNNTGESFRIAKDRTGTSGGTELFRVQEDGNVGIGTASPTTPLAVHSDAGVVIKIDGSTSNTSRTLLFRSVGTGEGIVKADGNMHFLQEDASRYMRFSTANTERMRIDASGNVLFNTTNTLTSAELTAGETGIAHRSGDLIIVSRDGGAGLLVNRKTSDGDLIDFRKNGSVVGSIGSEGGDSIYIGNGDTGLKFSGGADAIQPFNTSTVAARDNAIDLGTSGARFKNLFINGFISDGGNGAVQSRAVASGGVTAIRMQQSRGTISSPTSSAAGGDGNYIVGEVHNGSTFNAIGHIAIVTDNGSINDGNILFRTALSGTITTKMHLDSDGSLYFPRNFDGSLAGGIQPTGNYGYRLFNAGGSTSAVEVMEGYLSFKSGGLTASEERMRIDVNGNVGINQTPNAWRSLDKAIEFQYSSINDNSGTLSIGRNHYLNSAGNWIAKDTTTATVYQQADRAHKFWQAGTTTSGSSISYQRIAQFDQDGLKFGNDTAAANALDDYEEGTWEPQIIGSSSNPSVTYHSDTGGKYVKIGQLVYLTGTIRTTAISGGSGQFWIVNIPFANGTRTNGDNSDGIGAANCVLWNGTSNRKPTTIKSKHNDTVLYAYSGSHDQVDNILNVGDWGSTCQMSFTIVMWTN